MAKAKKPVSVADPPLSKTPPPDQSPAHVAGDEHLLVIGPLDRVAAWASGKPYDMLAGRHDTLLYRVPSDAAGTALDAARDAGIHAERTIVADCHMCGSVARKYGQQPRGNLWFFKCLNCTATFSSAAPVPVTR